MPVVVQLSDVVEELLTQLQSTLDDDLSDTRLLSCRVLSQLFSCARQDLDQDRLHTVYPCLLKCLDDSCDDVRLAASRAFSEYLRCFHGNYDVAMYRAHIEHIYDGLLVHLDDQCIDVQQAVLGRSAFTLLTLNPTLGVSLYPFEAHCCHMGTAIKHPVPAFIPERHSTRMS